MNRAKKVSFAPLPSPQCFSGESNGGFSPQFSEAGDVPHITYMYTPVAPNYFEEKKPLNPTPNPFATQPIQYGHTSTTSGTNLPFQRKSRWQVNPNSTEKNFGRIKLRPLKEYAVPAEIQAIEQRKDAEANEHWLSMLLRLKRNRTYADKYLEAYSTMIYLEEATQSQFLAQFKAENIQLECTENGDFCFRNNANTSKIDDAIGENLLDHFTMTPKPARNTHAPDFIPLKTVCFSGQVQSCNKEYIFVKFPGEHVNQIRSNWANNRSKFNIVFHANRAPFQLQHTALDCMKQHNLFPCLINNSTYDTMPECSTDYGSHTFRGEWSLRLNEEQKTAVANIVNGSNFPLPYLLFGPAGTGKTRTLVAAIEEIVRTSDKFVLVCANSNAACDEITERLMFVLQPGEMFRLYTSSYDARKMNDRFKEISNWTKDAQFPFPIPPLEYLYNFRVLICTLATAGNLARADNKNTNHFSHVIIDECASTHETMTLIPIVGLCSAPNKIETSIVIAGDPKQLDAVTKSKYAVQLGFTVSFMEQLMKRTLYQRDSRTGQYNQNYITQLVKNYRSHKAILHVANTLFYENKLQVSAAKDTTDWYIGTELLKSKEFPIIFHSVQGFVSKSSKNFSSFNSKEVNVVIEYINKLLTESTRSGRPIEQTDIGVVTPYKLQSKVIARTCRRQSFNDVTVGTAEVFQGQEKPVMIVSTVCSDGSLGFVADPRRMNVIITRAKSLLIIVGDPHTLRNDKNWFALIQYCIKNKAFINGEKRFHIPVLAP